jgi:hypothetical protein
MCYAVYVTPRAYTYGAAGTCHVHPMPVLDGCACAVQ